MKRFTSRTFASIAISLCVACTLSPVASASEAPEAKKAPAGVTSWIDSPLSYEYDYSLGWSFFYSPEMVMDGADTHFYATFPFDENCGSFGNIPPLHSPYYVCTLRVGGTANPVAVTGRTATSFKFKSLAGHVEGADRNIRFTFYQTSTFELRMKVEGWGPWNAAAAGSIYSGAVNQIWTTYANNLKIWISNGNL